MTFFVSSVQPTLSSCRVDGIVFVRAFILTVFPCDSTVFSGGAGFHAYGKLGWARRSRVFEYTEDGTITTWKRLDPFYLGKNVTIDHEQLWPKSGTVYEKGLKKRHPPNPVTLGFHPADKFHEGPGAQE